MVQPLGEFARKSGGKFNTTMRWRDVASFWIVLHLSLTGAPSLALLLLSLISGPDFREWLDCWVIAEFFRASSFGKDREEK